MSHSTHSYRGGLLADPGCDLRRSALHHLARTTSTASQGEEEHLAGLGGHGDAPAGALTTLSGGRGGGGGGGAEHEGGGLGGEAVGGQGHGGVGAVQKHLRRKKVKRNVCKKSNESKVSTHLDSKQNNDKRMCHSPTSAHAQQIDRTNKHNVPCAAHFHPRSPHYQYLQRYSLHHH